MPWGQSEGANRRSQPKPWDSQRERKNSAVKSSNLSHRWAAHRTKDWANTRGELANRGLAHPSLEARRQVGDSQSRKARGKLGPRDSILYQTASRLQVAIQVFWDPGWLTSARSFAARDQHPKRDTAHLRQCSHCAPRKPSGWDGEGDKTHRPPGECALAKHLVPELLGPGKGTKRRPDRVCVFVEYPRTRTWVA